jgi:hypothetical protein
MELAALQLKSLILLGRNKTPFPVLKTFYKLPLWTKSKRGKLITYKDSFLAVRLNCHF